jgi:predicted nucleic acid-binding protein
VLAAFELDWKALIVVGMTDRVMAGIPRLCKRHALRGADAVHLASAAFLMESGIAIEFVSADARLLIAAEKQGFVCVDPEREER